MQWTLVAYRSPFTADLWEIPSAKELTRQEHERVIDFYMKEERAGKIWLMQRRVGQRGENTFELVYKKKARRSKLRGIDTTGNAQAGKENLSIK